MRGYRIYTLFDGKQAIFSKLDWLCGVTNGASNKEWKMIDHIGLPVADLESSKALYTAALAPLGYAVQYEDGSSVGLGVEGAIDLWLYQKPGAQAGSHLAFVASTRAQVDRFYSSACENGACDNGSPGVRTDYAPSYYAAFVLDADGHNIEVVCYGD